MLLSRKLNDYYKEAVEDFNQKYSDLRDFYKREENFRITRDIEYGVWPAQMLDNEDPSDFALSPKDEKFPPTTREIYRALENFKIKYPERKCHVYIWTRIYLLYKEEGCWETEPTEDQVYVEFPAI